MKNNHITLLITAIITTSLLLLVACGNFDPSTYDGSSGSGGGSSSSSSSASVSGVAASGLPISGIVNVTDADGNTRSKTTDNEGSFSINVEGLTPPFLVCVNGTVMDRSIELCSTVTGAGRANITPITDLILRNVVGVATGNAKANWQALSAGVDDNTIEQVNEQLALQLEPMLQAVGLSNDVDFISTPFDADMTGMDMLLDGLDISYNGAGTVATITNEFDNTNSITDDITTTVDNDSNTLANDTAICDQFMDDNNAINAIWDELELLFNEGLPTTGELDAFFNEHVASDFMDSDGISAGHKHFFSSGTSWPVPNGTITSIINGPVDAADLGSYLKGSWVHVSVTSNDSNNVFRTSVGWDGTKWHWRGNREQLKFRLPDTGQTTSYTTTFGEDSDYIINPPSHTLREIGIGTIVEDNITGFIWEHNAGSNYLNYYSAKDACENMSTTTAWRLPTVKEWTTILHYEYADPMVSHIDFPNHSNAPSPWAMKGWTLSLWYGGIVIYDPTEQFHVRPSYCISGTGYPDSQLSDNNDGTISEYTTNLMWQKEDDGKRKVWEEALTYCEDSTLAGYTDWRLPNMNELISISNPHDAPSINTSFFPSNNGYQYWSSTVKFNAPHPTAWYVDYSYSSTWNRLYIKYDGISSSLLARCVRSIQ